MKDRILRAAVRIAISRGLARVTRPAVARNGRLTPSLISYHYGSVPALRTAVIQYAIENCVLPIIAAALLAKHPAVEKLDEQLKKDALLNSIAA